MVWELLADEKITAFIEATTFFGSLLILFVILYLRFKYPKLTAKGFVTLFWGSVVFSLHILFDLLDTLVAKKINDQTTIYYTVFDLLDAIFSFIGLFIIGFGFLRIAQYGMVLWKEDA